MHRLLLLALLLSALPSFSQNNIGKDRAFISRYLDKYVSENKAYQASWKNTDKGIELKAQDEEGHPVYFRYGFDGDTGKCITEETVSACESCYRKYLDRLLAMKKYEWKKINENQYVSRFSDYLMIEIQQDDNEFSFTLIKTEWTRPLYEMMKKE